MCSKKRSVLRVILPILCAMFVIYILLYIKYKNTFISKPPLNNLKIVNKYITITPDIIIACVVCGDRLNEALTMLKSAIVFSMNARLKFIIFAENNLLFDIDKVLNKWTVNTTLSYELKKLSFPVKNNKEWKNLFKPCAAQRLFLPDLLTDIDSVLYVDTDTIFMAPLYITWNLFKEFNATQLAGLSPEHEDPNVGWYNRFAKHPYYGKLGVNSGVMLMNLTRMRHFQWSKYVLPIYQKYKNKISWGDQDIINIIFHYQSDKLYVFPCLFNYRPDHCMYMSVCNPQEPYEGVIVLHGNRGYFHSLKQPIFHTVYEAMANFDITSDPYQNFLAVVEKFVETNSTTNCGKVKDLFLTYSRKYIKNNS